MQREKVGMRIASGTCVLFGLACAAPATAQSYEGSPARDDVPTPVSFGEIRPASSPSNATATVSPTTVPQAMEKLEDRPSDFVLSLGTIYAGGDFGTNSNTSIISSAIGARFRTGGLRLTASLPWMRIRSNATIFTGIDSTPVLVAADNAARRRTSRGFGDLTLGAAYSVTPTGSDLELELSGRVKLDTATRSSGLSSGEKDYAVGLQVTKPVGRFGPFVSATYRALGDTATFRLRDGFAGSVGSSVLVGERTFVLASYHYAEAATRLVRDSHELFLGASTPIARTRLRVTAFGTAGLSRGAAARSVGVALSRSF